MKISIYTDGGADNISQDIGGWGVVVVKDNESVIDEFSGVVSLPKVTNNICELLAFEKALDIAEEYGATRIISDSQYVVNGYSEWMHNWAKKDWLKNGYQVKINNEKPEYVKNLDIWKRIFSKYSTEVKVLWVRGHDGNEFNELADVLASKYKDQI